MGIPDTIYFIFVNFFFGPLASPERADYLPTYLAILYDRLTGLNKIWLSFMCFMWIYARLLLSTYLVLLSIRRTVFSVSSFRYRVELRDRGLFSGWFVFI